MSSLAELFHEETVANGNILTIDEIKEINNITLFSDNRYILFEDFSIYDNELKKVIKDVQNLFKLKKNRDKCGNLDIEAISIKTYAEMFHEADLKASTNLSIDEIKSLRYVYMVKVKEFIIFDDRYFIFKDLSVYDYNKKIPITKSYEIYKIRKRLIEKINNNMKISNNLLFILGSISTQVI